MDGEYLGPGLSGSSNAEPIFKKRLAFPIDHIGLVNSSANINFPKDVYALFLASSVSFISINI